MKTMADLKAFAEQLVGLTVKEVNELAKILKEEYGIEPAAAAVAGEVGPSYQCCSCYHSLLLLSFPAGTHRRQYMLLLQRLLTLLWVLNRMELLGTRLCQAVSDGEIPAAKGRLSLLCCCRRRPMLLLPSDSKSCAGN